VVAQPAQPRKALLLHSECSMDACIGADYQLPITKGPHQSEAPAMGGSATHKDPMWLRCGADLPGVQGIWAEGGPQCFFLVVVVATYNCPVHVICTDSRSQECM
jgi:hypothetical protein